MAKKQPFAFIPDDFDFELDELERLSNSVVDLIAQKRFDEATAACVELKRRYPDQMDWISRSAAVHEAQGQFGQAIEYQRQCIAFIEAHPDDFDRDDQHYYLDEIKRLQSRQ